MVEVEELSEGHVIPGLDREPGVSNQHLDPLKRLADSLRVGVELMGHGGDHPLGARALSAIADDELKRLVRMEDLERLSPAEQRDSADRRHRVVDAGGVPVEDPFPGKSRLPERLTRSPRSERLIDCVEYRDSDRRGAADACTCGKPHLGPDMHRGTRCVGRKRHLEGSLQGFARRVGSDLDIPRFEDQ